MLQSYLKTREGELEIKEREITSRRRDLEQWDSLLREKDRKVVAEQRQLEEREETLRVLEGKVGAREADGEKRLIDLRQKEAEATILVEKYRTLREDVEAREKYCVEQTSKYNTVASQLAAKESLLKAKEGQMKDMEIRFRDITVREKELEARIMAHNKAVEKFYNVDVSTIMSRHAREMSELEELVQQQLVLVSTFQAESVRVRHALTEVTKEKVHLAAVVDAKCSMIAKLQNVVNSLEEERERLSEEVYKIDSIPALYDAMIRFDVRALTCYGWCGPNIKSWYMLGGETTYIFRCAY